MADCTDYPTPEDAKRFKNNAGSVDEFVTSDSDTFVDQDGGEHITIEGIDTLAETQRSDIQQRSDTQYSDINIRAETQRDQFNATFQAQFQYARIGNISDFVGDTLNESEKLNSYQYPDDSDNWYGPIQSQAFPITIPADPTVSGSGWVLMASSNIYRGLWPDTGGSANKGDTYQTQISGTPTGQYFTALQNTTVDPIGDNVNWRLINSASSISLAVKDAISPNPVSVQDAIDYYGVFVEEFRQDADNDSDTINRALKHIGNLPYVGTKLIFERGRAYSIDRSSSLGQINDLHIDLNGATLKRADGGDTSTTLSQPIPTLSGTYTIEVNDASVFRVGDFVNAIAGSDFADTSGDARRIQSISGNTITLNSDFRFTPEKTSLQAGTIIARNFKIFEGRPSSTDNTTVLPAGINRKIFITNGVIDGNSSTQLSNSWRFANEILLHSYKGLINNVEFKNTTGECIVGHGISVDNNSFTDLSGSAFHTSMNDENVNNSSGSWFINNQCKRTNQAGNTALGHSEGLVTFSWGGGNLIIADNNCEDGAEGFIGDFTSSTGANPDRLLIVSNNIVKRFRTIAFAISPTADGVMIDNNIFDACGDFTALAKQLGERATCSFSGNVTVGGTIAPNYSKSQYDFAGNTGVGHAFTGKVRRKLTESFVANIPTYDTNVVETIESVSGAYTAYASSGLMGTIFYTPNGRSSGDYFFQYDPSAEEFKAMSNTANGKTSLYSGFTVKTLSCDDGDVVAPNMTAGNNKGTYFGDKNTDGSWRVIISGANGDLLYQRRESGSWVTKQSISA